MEGKSVGVDFQLLSCIRFISLWAGHGVFDNHMAWFGVSENQMVHGLKNSAQS